MKNKSSGFMILELLMAVFISTMAISMSLGIPRFLVRLASIFQVQSKNEVQRVRFLDLVEKDLSCALLLRMEDLAQPKNIKIEKVKSDDPENKTQRYEKTEEASDDQEEKPSVQLVSFYASISQDNNLEKLSLLTTNALEYSVKPKSRYLRVTYFFEKYQDEDKQKIKVYRQESSDFIGQSLQDKVRSSSKNETKQGKKILVMDNLLSIEAKFWFFEEKPENEDVEKKESVDNQSDKTENAQEPQLSSKNSWIPSQEKSLNNKLPAYVELIGFADNRGVKLPVQRFVALVLKPLEVQKSIDKKPSEVKGKNEKQVLATEGGNLSRDNKKKV